MFSDFTYHVTSGATETQLTPIISDLIFEGREDDNLGRGIYTETIATEFRFAGTDYSYLYDNWEASGICERLPFTIKYNGTQYRNKGFLKMGSSNISVDVSNCRIAASIDASGSYTCLEDGWEAEFNLLDATPTRTVNPFFGVIQCQECTDPAPGDPIDFTLSSIPKATSCGYTTASGWTTVKNVANGVTQVGTNPDIYEAQTSIVTTYCREFVSGGSTPPGDGWISVAGGFARTLTAIFNEDASDLDPSDNQLTQVWDVAGYNVDTEEITAMDNAVLLSNALDEFNPCGNTIISDFFSINPDGTAPANAVYATASGSLSDMVILQKSDVKRPLAAQNAVNGPWTYKEMLESLHAQFNAEWRITSGGLRIEHTSYFSATNGLDLTAAPYASRIAGLQSYEYDNTELAQQEKWAFMETVSEDFRGVPVIYGNCVADDAEDERPIPIGEVNNDIAFIQANTDQVSDEGFTFINTYREVITHYVISEISKLDNATRVYNGHMSIPNLQHHYHKHERLLPTGTMNNAATTFESSIRRKRQVQLQVAYSREDFANFDASQLVKTQLGWGKVEQYRYNAKTCQLTLIIRHE